MKTNLLLCGLACAFGATAAFAADEGITKSPAAAASGEQVGIARRDGVTVSGAEAYVTRNGVTEKLVKELQLPSGVVVRPDGSITLKSGHLSSLKADQLLTFGGAIVNVPRDPNVNPAPVARQPAAIAAAPATANSGAGANRTSTFVGSDGKPFQGTVTSSGIITRSDGTTMPIDGSIQSIVISPDGTTSTGIILPNGTIRASNGSTIFPDGSIRGVQGNMISGVTATGGAAVSPAMLNPAGTKSTSGATTTTGASGQSGAANQQAISGQQGTGNQFGNGSQQGVTNQQGTTTQQGTTNQQGTTTQQGTINPQGSTQPVGATTPQGNGQANVLGASTEQSPAQVQQGNFVTPQGTAPQSTNAQRNFTTPQGTTPQQGNGAQNNFVTPQGNVPQAGTPQGNFVSPQGTTPQAAQAQAAQNRSTTLQPGANNQFRSTSGTQAPRQPGNTAPRTQGNTPATNGNAGGAVTNGGTGAGGGAPAAGAAR